MNKPGPTEFLKSLGPSSDSVAVSLYKLGVKGKKRSPCNCPIAVALKQFSSCWPGIYVYPRSITYKDDQIIDPATTPAVTEFLIRFDIGHFDHLEARP